MIILHMCTINDNHMRYGSLTYENLERPKTSQNEPKPAKTTQNQPKNDLKKNCKMIRNNPTF